MDRKAIVGASEVASLFYYIETGTGHKAVPVFDIAPHHEVVGCVSPYRSAAGLYALKKGKLEETEENEPMKAGKFLQDGIKAWAAEKWDLKIGPETIVAHPTIPRFSSTPDGLLDDPLEPVEIKNVDRFVFRDSWVSDGDVILDMPMHIRLQVQAQMACAGAERGHIIACVGGNSLYKGTISRSAQIISLMEGAVQRFWEAFDQNKMPMPDYDTLAEVYKEANSGLELDLRHEEAFGEACAEYLWARKDLAAAEKRVDEIKARIAERMGEATKATTEGFSVTWPVIRTDERMVLRKANTYRGGMIVKERAA